MAPEQPERPMNRRGAPKTRFNPLRDEIPAENVNEDDFLTDFDESEGGGAFFDPTTLISAVRAQITTLGLLDSVEGTMALTAAGKAVEANGSAAAACLHELRMIMDAIKAGRAPESTGDATEDVLGRRRRERGA